MADACKKILCIEHDRDTAKLIAEELSKRGFYVVIAYDGRVGLSAILRHIPDLVLCEVGLPGLSGFDVLASMNTSLPLGKRVPFILLTEMRSRSNELRGRNLGADDYVVKPIDFDILEAIVRARLVRGVVRRDLDAIPMPRGKKYKGPTDQALWGRIIELTNAPAVDYRPDPAEGGFVVTSSPPSGQG